MLFFLHSDCDFVSDIVFLQATEVGFVYFERFFYDAWPYTRFFAINRCRGVEAGDEVACPSGASYVVRRIVDRKAIVIIYTAINLEQFHLEYRM